MTKPALPLSSWCSGTLRSARPGSHMHRYRTYVGVNKVARLPCISLAQKSVPFSRQNVGPVYCLYRVQAHMHTCIPSCSKQKAAELPRQADIAVLMQQQLSSEWRHAASPPFVGRGAPTEHS